MMIPVRKSTVFLLFTGFNLAVITGMGIDAVRRNSAAAPGLAEQRSLVKSLDLTDLVLFTDARYTRHPAMADRHAPFQDHPLSIEHFPSGSLMPPPPHVRDNGQH